MASSAPNVVQEPTGHTAPATGSSPEALTAFEQGVQALQRHEFSQAAERFRAVRALASADSGLRDRTGVYLALCERELRGSTSNPQTVEERLTAATAALNNGEDDAAERLAKAVLVESPRHDLALYLLAAVEARRGATNSALDLLAQAIEARPDVRAQARHDTDFEALHAFEVFQQLIETPSSALAIARKSRRVR